MKSYLYLSIFPEALIASMLPPEAFGAYMAVGTRKRSRGQEIFFDVRSAGLAERFPLGRVEDECVPHADGRPKCSLYLAVYRVLERIPIDALGDLYLVTHDGKVLRLTEAPYTETGEPTLHLYQELCPVMPRIASRLDPAEFVGFVTDPRNAVSVPRILFVELVLNHLGRSPATGSDGNLPYPNLPHLRDCLGDLKNSPGVSNKTVARLFSGELLYRTCKNGFFVGDSERLRFYRFPSVAELEERHFQWWHSALTVSFP